MCYFVLNIKYLKFDKSSNYVLFFCFRLTFKFKKRNYLKKYVTLISEYLKIVLNRFNRYVLDFYLSTISTKIN